MKPLVVIVWLSACCINIQAQTGFSRDTNIPVEGANGQLDMPWAGGLNFPVFSEIDLNGDNIKDLFAFDKSNNRVVTFLNYNSGGYRCWRYAPQYADQFPVLRSWAFLYDYNCDGKPDIFTCNFRNNGIAQYRNDSQGQNISFTLVDSTMLYNYTGVLTTNIGASGYLVPTFNDIDNDGDMDIVGQQFQCVGGYAYYKNLSMEHTGGCDSLNDYVVDHNVWGDFTMRSGGYQNVAVGSYNVSCSIFSPPVQNNDPELNYYQAERDDTYASIFTIDIDNDGDKDALIGDSGAKNSLLVINGGDSTHATMIPQGTDTLFPSYDVSVHEAFYSLHAYIDCDNDGVKDLIISPSEWQNHHGIQFYKNTGTTALPHFQYQMNDLLQSQMIDVGESATPVFFDVDGDGLKDLIIGNRNKTVNDSLFETSLTLYKNTGSVTSPAFQFVTDDFAGLKSLALQGQIFPAFGDVDHDNDADMLVGVDNGVMCFFENTAGPGLPLTFGAPVFNYMGIDVGQACAPQLIDLNRDDFVDLVIGQKNGLIKYFENTQNSSTPFAAIATKDTLGGIVLQYTGSTDGYVVPFIFDQNGDYRMVASYMEGYAYLYGNIDGNINGNFTILDTIVNNTEGSRYGYCLSVSGGDLNGDTLTDLVFGLFGGGVQIYYQDNLANGIADAGTENLFDVMPNPASDKLVIKCYAKHATVRLVDVSGRKVMEDRISGGYHLMNISAIAEGTYFLNVVSDGKSSSRKIVIQR